MKIHLEDGLYDTRIEPSDWRYSAAIVGLVRYFSFHEIEYSYDDDGLNYCTKDLDERRYLDFVEHYFSDDMHHKKIEGLISRDELSDELTKSCNDLLKGNSICKKVFGNLKYEKKNVEEIQKLVDDNRADLIKETFRNGHKLYAKYCNTSLLLKEETSVCRILGYYVDTGRKIKSLSYAFDKKTFVHEDIPEFDYIPFAFTKTYEGFFINNNATIEQLIKTNNNLQKSLDDVAELNPSNARHCVFMPTAYAETFITYDVEVILKSWEHEYFETMLIRKKATEIFSQIRNEYIMLTYPCYVEKCGIDNNGFIPVEQIVTDSIVNFTHLDHLIEILLKAQEKEKNPQRFVALLNVLLKINCLIYGGEKMDIKLYKAREAAAEVEKKLFAKRAENKLNSYKQKLISAITFKDYDRFCEVLLQMSSYTGVPFEFAYDLFEDFEANKNVAYAFVNRLNGEYKKPENEEEKNEEK